MDSYLFLSTVVATIGFLLFYGKFRLHQDIKKTDSSSLTLVSSPSSSSSSLTNVLPDSPPSVLSRNRIHDVFSSFRGEDVRRDFFSHIQKGFERKGIRQFIDKEIKRGKSISSELIKAIRGSKIAVVLISRNYASSSWCLDELVKIMNCRIEFGQIVIAVFYKVDPSDVRKQTGEFGKIFKKTCAGKTKEEINRWTLVLAEVATIAGYDSSTWDNEAAIIENIANDVSKKLTLSMRSIDFKDSIGMRAHMENMSQLLCLDLDEVRMIGIWGPSEIGKSTITRFLFNNFSRRFQVSSYVKDLKALYARPNAERKNLNTLQYFDKSWRYMLLPLLLPRLAGEPNDMLFNQNVSIEHLKNFSIQTRECSTILSISKAQLPKYLLKNIKLTLGDNEVFNLEVERESLKEKKVLVVIDNVDEFVNLDEIVEESQWFGPGSRIILAVQDRKLLKEHRINHNYRVSLPSNYEALQIFCLNSFGQTFPKDGFEDLVRKVVNISGNLPLRLKIMGSYFRGMTKQEWIDNIH